MSQYTVGKRKKAGLAVLLLFILLNVVAAFHAYRFTHFIETQSEKTKDPKSLSVFQKIGTLVFGVKNPRPVNLKTPSDSFEIIELASNKKIEAWYIKTLTPKGTVILFHGFGGSKSGLLDKAELFKSLGYNTLLVDFMGSGGSEGNQTTIGFYEAEEVKTCFEYIEAKGEKNIILFGTSMGAVAIMKALKEYPLHPKKTILECPFGSMYQTVCARFNTMKVPSFPMAGLLVFWGGIENGFWAFNHHPIEYAKSINSPTLLLYGQKDEKVSKEEIDKILENLTGIKECKIYPNAGHENYLNKYKNEWVKDVANFLNTN
ncbi:MAG: alpha/beta hydrolase [Bacteroidetes bacterium B1(2017)]|nr:MAG: alpha/beta hydrolase [Bacteroidetes bacterium B1(2017)]